MMRYSLLFFIFIFFGQLQAQNKDGSQYIFLNQNKLYLGSIEEDRRSVITNFPNLEFWTIWAPNVKGDTISLLASSPEYLSDLKKVKERRIVFLASNGKIISDQKYFVYEEDGTYMSKSKDGRITDLHISSYIDRTNSFTGEDLDCPIRGKKGTLYRHKEGKRFYFMKAYKKDGIRYGYIQSDLSNDGSKIVCIHKDFRSGTLEDYIGSGEIIEIDTKTKKIKNAGIKGGHPIYSKDGKYISYFTEEGKVMIHCFATKQDIDFGKQEIFWIK